ncbi:MAG: glycoside hydrolase family 88 protein [Treponema sp.]|jgi:unsaturated rhamnogalacturonyl hydrolase|nr:glycoside hydrolase family 88 protein [Treponema sp.]
MYVIDKTKPVSERMALSVMNRYKPEQVKWHYEHGLALQSIYMVGEKTGNSEYGRWVKAMYDTKIRADGTIGQYREDEYNLDMINPGKTLFRLYRDFGEEQYRAAIETLRGQLRRHPRTSGGGFWHKKIYPYQMWLDGLYMQGPFYAQYAAEYGTASDFEDITGQFILMEAKAADKETGLLYHAWDESKAQPWAHPDTGCSPHFWGRAMGWYSMALIDVLDFIPSDAAHHKQREDLRGIAKRLAEGILCFQDKQCGLWHQVLNKGGFEKNYLETSASAMFVYFLLKGIRTGVLSKEAVKGAALAAYRGLLEQKITEDPSGELHLSGICAVAGLGGNPYRDGSFEYYVGEPVVADDFKGVGPFILASLEREETE